MKNYYEILEINRNASQEVVKTAYRRLAKKYHPDINRDSTINSTEKMTEITEAYNVLKDDKKRKNYNFIYDKYIKNIYKEKHENKSTTKESKSDANQKKQKKEENFRTNYEKRAYEGTKWEDNSKKDAKEEYTRKEYASKDENRNYRPSTLTIILMLIVIIPKIYNNIDFSSNDRSFYKNEEFYNIGIFLKEENPKSKFYETSTYNSYTDEFNERDILVALPQEKYLTFFSRMDDDSETYEKNTELEVIVVLGYMGAWYDVYVIGDKFEGYAWIRANKIQPKWYNIDKGEFQK